MVVPEITGVLGTGQFIMTAYLVLEVSQIRRDLERADEVETSTPPVIDMFNFWKGGKA